MKKNLYSLAAAAMLAGASFAANAQTISTYAGNGSPGSSGDLTPATTAEINQPYGTATDASGNVYIADAANAKVRVITSSGIIATICGTGTPGITGDGLVATAAQLSYPMGVAVDASGNIYIADKGNNNVRKITKSTGIISTIAGSVVGSPGTTGDNGAATAALLNQPVALALDAAGDIFVVDNGNNRVRKISSGTISAYAGIGGAGAYGGDNGPATAGQLWGPAGIAIDGNGQVYISDSGNNRVRYVDHLTSKIFTLAGIPTAGFSGDGGAAGSAKLNKPLGLAVDASNNVYIADFKNNCVRRVSASSAAITTVVGTPPTAGIGGDGSPASAAGLNLPADMTFDASGNMYIGDIGNNKVRKVTPFPTIAILGASTTSVCIKATETLSDAIAGGTWSSSASAIATVGTSGIVTGVAAGTATITYKTTTDAATQTVTVTNCTSHVGVANTETATSGLKVFPNPNNGAFAVLISSPLQEQATIIVTNIVGVQVKTFTTATNKETDMKLDVAPGIYFLTASSPTEKWSEKVSVMH